MTNPSVSIIVPCYNEIDYIVGFLNEVASQRYGSDICEVLIADGMSRDGTRELLADRINDDKKLCVIDNPERIVSTGLNRCIEHASGDIIVRMDVHTKYDQDYVGNCVSVLLDTNADCVGGAWRVDPAVERESAIALAFQSRIGSGGAHSRKTEISDYVDTVYLGCWHTSYLREMGGFDPKMVRNQDDELCHRIRLNGGTVYQSASIVSYYTIRNSMRLLAKQFYQYGYWRPRTIIKHRSISAMRQFYPAFLVVLLSVLVVWASFSIFGAVVLFSFIAIYLISIGTLLFAQFGQLRPMHLTFIATICVAIMHISYGAGFLYGLVAAITGEKDITDYATSRS